MKFFVVISILFIYFSNVIGKNATDFVDILSNSILKPLISSQENEYNDPDDFFIINAFESEHDIDFLEDYSSETEYPIDSSVKTTEMTSESTMKESETNEILEMTANYHNMRVQIVNLTHTIQKQQEIITQQIKTLHDLEKSIKKRKMNSDRKMNELKVKNEGCRTEFNSVFHKLSVAKKIISMEKYSQGLKKKLEEFGVVGLKNSGKTFIRFSMFEVESDEISGKIMSNRELFFLPPNVGHIFPNISELSVSHCGLIALNNNSFEGMESLEIFNASWNKISEIEHETFLNLEHLKILDLSYNAISMLENSAFEGLNELEKLFLDHNRIYILQSDVFNSLLNLTVLNLSFNIIKELKEEIFTIINVVEEFYINNNELEVINPEIIIDFETSKIIDLRNNTCIDHRFPDTLTMLQIGIEVTTKCWQMNNSELLEDK